MLEQLCVLDTSVVVPWFFSDDPQRADSLLVREVLKQNPDRFVVPHLFHAEFLHVCARKSGRDARFVRQALDVFVGLGLRTLGLSRTGMRRSVEWTCKGMSGYDATFVALAEEVGGRWLTADARAAHLVGRKLATMLEDWPAT